MRNGLVISASLHSAVLFWVVAVFPGAEDLSGSQPVPVPVELVNSAEFTKIKVGEKKADKKPPQSAKKPDEPKQAKKESPKKTPKRKVARAPEPVTEPSEPAPKAKSEKSAPKPEPEPAKKASSKASPPMPGRKPKKVAKFTEPLKSPPRPRKKAAAKAKPRKKAFDPDNIAALLNKAPDAGRRVPAVAQEKTAEKKPVQGLAQGRDQKMTFSEIDALRARISECWNPPVGGLGAGALKVKLRLQLSRDGTLASRPEVMNRGSSPFFEAAADSAVRAVMLCQPYTLPQPKFALWRDMILNFDPKEMFDG